MTIRGNKDRMEAMLEAELRHAYWQEVEVSGW